MTKEKRNTLQWLPAHTMYCIIRSRTYFSEIKIFSNKFTDKTGVTIICDTRNFMFVLKNTTWIIKDRTSL